MIRQYQGSRRARELRNARRTPRTRSHDDFGVGRKEKGPEESAGPSVHSAMRKATAIAGGETTPKRAMRQQLARRAVCDLSGTGKGVGTDSYQVSPDSPFD